MSRFADDFTETALADLEYELGDTITRYPLGEVGDAESITGIFVETPSDGLYAYLPEGEKKTRTGSLQLSIDLTADDRDKYLIRGVVWFVTHHIPSDGAIQILQLKSSEQITHKQAAKK